ncbi:MAG TPA: hypothetical protein VNE18_10470 [Rhodanobacter sp.]|nr:hypothetical protein [Rhodanobacter sp.]
MTDDTKQKAKTSGIHAAVITAGVTLAGLIFNAGIEYNRVSAIQSQTANVPAAISSINATLTQMNERLGRLETEADQRKDH